MNGRSVVIYGAGGHGKVVADMIQRGQSYHIPGFLDEQVYHLASHVKAAVRSL